MPNKQKDLPPLSEVMERLMLPGTVLGALSFPAKPIIFKKAYKTAVKELAVNICSTETTDLAVLHTLYSQVRNI
jgi:hypothetical protein